MIYEYSCENCQPFEVYQHMTDAPLIECPTCKGKVERIIWGGVHACVKEVKTVGQLAEQNLKKYGKEKSELMLEEQKTKRKPGGDNAVRPMELPKGAKRNRSKPTKVDMTLANASPEEKRRYVETGIRPIPKKSNQNF